MDDYDVTNEDSLRGIFFKGYKSYEHETKFFFAENITLLIGKNNTGKSSVLDAIEYFIDEEKLKADKPQILNLTGAFSINVNHIKHGVQNREIHIAQDVFNNIELMYKKPYYPFSRIDNVAMDDSELLDKERFCDTFDLYRDGIDETYIYNLSSYRVLRLNAERNILPEKEARVDEKSMTVSYDGRGATNLLRAFINDSDKKENIVQEKLLTELNTIMYPDAIYESIKIQKNINDDTWEIYLTEKGGERIPLSKSGSGLKTIMLVLINILILSKESLFRTERIIYLFEELENNIHPALQRRLIDYLYNAIKGTENRMVLTTHSAVAINAVYSKKGNGIYHVLKNDKSSELRQVLSYEKQAEILDDIDVRASDILQANCIIWVEGPSDRVYVKRWLDLVSDNSCIEGVDYQILCYGGKLLSHYKVDEKSTSDFISILNINRHSIILMDSDKKNADETVRETKLRIEKESLESGNYVWITEGKEIENYIPVDAINQVYKAKESQIGQYDSFNDYIKSIKPNFIREKVQFAREIVPFINKDNYSILNLEETIQEVYSKIKEWNSK